MGVDVGEDYEHVDDDSDDDDHMGNGDVDVGCDDEVCDLCRVVYDVF